MGQEGRGVGTKGYRIEEKLIGEVVRGAQERENGEGLSIREKHANPTSGWSKKKGKWGGRQAASQRPDLLFCLSIVGPFKESIREGIRRAKKG